VETQGENSTYWRGRYWRGQVSAAFGFVLLFGVVLYFVARDIGFLLIAGAAVAFPIWLVIVSWLGLNSPKPGAPPQSSWRGWLLSAIGFVAAFLVGAWPRGGEPFRWQILLLLAPVVVAATARTLYDWRERQSRPIGLFPAPLARISLEGWLVQITSYAIGFTAAVAAAACFSGWTPRVAAYATAALIGKLAVDFIPAQPPPLNDRILSRALLRMTVVSVLWWGLPWAVLAAGFFHVQNGGDAHVEAAVRESIPVVSHVAIAVVLVFALLTMVVFLRQPRADAAWQASFRHEQGALLPADWVRLYWSVFLLALAAYLSAFIPFWRSDGDRFGVETWTCAKVDEYWELAWIGKAGVHIEAYGEAGTISFFNISCVPRADGRTCEYDDAGWDQVEFVVHGRDGFDTTVAFSRKSAGVDEEFRHHANVSGALATEILWALHNGKSADMTIRAPRGRLLYAKHIELRGYTEAFDACVPHWRKEYEQQRAGR
jgi:hypothetical protein